MGSLEGLFSGDGADGTDGRERPTFGLVTATVAAINDDGTYDLDYLTMGDGEPSAPARVMMPMAGQGRGVFFRPEVDDEVVVAFELGDVRLPIILGAVWNDDAPPPDQANPSPDNDIRTIVTRSGHELTFDDTPGAEKITLKTCGGHQLELDESTTGGGPGIRLQTAGGGAIDISDTTNTLTISSPVSIRLESPEVSIQADLAISLEAPMIRMETTGSAPGSMVVIDGKPFGIHIHTPFFVPPYPPGTTGPVAP